MDVSFEMGDLGSQTISQQHFGLNYVFQFERIGDQPWEKFDEIVQQMDISQVRYPGGTAAETIFNLLEPNNSEFIEEDGSVTQIMPLNRFLNFCQRSDIRPTIIVPTKVMLTGDYYDGHREFEASWRVDIFNFISDILNDSFPVGIDKIEIGNEYESHMTSREYGRVASEVVAIAQEAIDAFIATHNLSGDWVEPSIAVQVWTESVHGGVSLEELSERNSIVMSEFDAEGLSSVDSVVSHLYYSEGRHLGDDNQHSYDNISGVVASSIALMNSWAEIPNTNIEIGYSEWNVLHRSFENFGMKQISTVLSLFQEFLLNGVSELDFWSAQYHPTSLAFANGNSTVMGEVFEFMTDELVGLRPVDLNVDTSDLDIFGFQSEESFVLFSTSRVESEFIFNVNINEVLDNFQLVSAVEFGVDTTNADGTYRGYSNLLTFEEPDLPPVITNLNITEILSEDDFIFEYDPYGVVALIFEPRPTFENMQVLLGDSANNTLVGNTQNASFSGLDGNDILRAGSAANSMKGGAGADCFVFDNMGTDNIIHDFEVGIDKLDLSGFSSGNRGFHISVNEQGFDKTLRTVDDPILEDMFFSIEQVGESSHVIGRIGEEMVFMIEMENIDLTNLTLDDFVF
ncbi:calcium-binding protein [Cochlodiniinecator piscidefendens]|uniref:hypothetical protein n=1 Tax=Cochlodiniinecator piscidefendens TaxID=2715756 RepID=UPI0014076115|nr:hypothetical protein [Cochlodiniinecator piscidefendens]